MIRDDAKIIVTPTGVSLKEALTSEETKRKIGLRCSVPVYQYTLDMKFVKAYPSAASASRETGICSEQIRKCRRGFYKHAGGYIWRFNKVDE